jgi:serine/threonine protein kinase
VRGSRRLGNARYARLGTIATGGMGKVYLGRAQIGDAIHTVAIKVLHPHLAREADMVAMFLDEARVSIKLHHPNIVHVWDIDLVGEELVIVMEYIEGATLSHLSRAVRASEQVLPVGIVARMLTDGLMGLHAAHELVDDDSNPLGLVHRDFSPQNLLVGVDGITRVTDFGVALSAGRLAQTQGEAVKGKLRYLAPEQVLRRKLDRRLDIFSAGIVLWECLTGRRLFDGGTEAETLTQVMREAIPPPSMLRPDLPSALDEVCLRALERDPDRRFPTAAEFAEALGAAVEGKLATPGEVGIIVMEAARTTILEHRLTLEEAERSPTLDDPTAAEVEIPALAPRPSMRLAVIAVVGVLCLLIGGTAVRLATRTAPSVETKSASGPSAGSEADPSNAVPMTSVAAIPSAAPVAPASTVSEAQPAHDTPTTKPTVSTSKPVRSQGPSKPKPHDAFMPPEL